MTEHAERAVADQPTDPTAEFPQSETFTSDEKASDRHLDPAFAAMLERVIANMGRPTPEDQPEFEGWWVLEPEPVERPRKRQKGVGTSQSAPEDGSARHGPENSPAEATPSMPNGQDAGLAVTNAEFLTAIFDDGHDDPEHESAVFVTGFPADPGDKTKAKWRGWCAPLSTLRTPNTTGNTYYSPSSFIIGATSRSIANGQKTRAFVLDDPQGTMPLKPSYVLQTSPNSTQVGFLTNAPIARVNNLLKALVKRGVITADPSGNNAVRWVRLPEGHNTKPKYGTPFKHRMLEWEPQRVYTIEELEAAFGSPQAPKQQAPKQQAPKQQAPKQQASKQQASRQQANDDEDRIGDDVLIANIISGTSYHDSTIQLAARYAAQGMKRDSIVDILKGIYDGAPSIKDTWAERRADIERSVDSAIAKFGPKAPPRLDYIEHTTDDGTQQRTGFLTSAHDVQDENIEWVWKHRLARGALHLIAGIGGTAKSTIAFTWAATISSGGTFPDNTKAPIGKVAIWSGEDNYATTIKPRMRAAGANFDNVLFLTGARINESGEPVEFNPAEHMPALRQELQHHPDITLLIIDPIVSAIKGDSHKNAEVRKDLQPLIDLLEDSGIVGIGITHYTKGTAGRHVVERVTGSLAFGAIARMIFATVQERDVPSKYRVIVGKTNIAPLGGGYEYSVGTTDLTVNGKTIEATKITWGDALEGEPMKLIADAEGPPTGRPPEKREDAEKLLRDLLANGPVQVADIRKAGEAHGISYDTLKRARKGLGIITTQVDPKNNRSPWQWATTGQTMAEVIKGAKTATKET